MSEFIISRVFNASVDVIFEMWSDPKHVGQWLAPNGGKTHFKKAEIRAGGMSHYYIETPIGKMWGKIAYREVQKPTKLVYVQSFSDENENITRHPMMPNFPREMLTTVLFEDVGAKTKLTLTWVPINATAEEWAAFESAKGGMSQGWGGSFKQLDAYLTA